MEAKLIVVGGKANKAEVKLTLPAVIGRGRDADLTVAHSTVSRRHCLLYEKEGALVVRDNGSLNGTVIEGERISEAVLRPGDTLTVGPLTFRAEYDHFGAFPALSEQPTLPNVHETLGDKQGPQIAATQHEEPATSAVAPVAEASEFDFLTKKNNETAPEPAFADSDSELSAVEEAELPELPADIGSLLESSLPELDPPADDDAPSFGFLSDSNETRAAEESAEPKTPTAEDDSASFGSLTEPTRPRADDASANQQVENAESPSESLANAAAAEDEFSEAPLAEASADSGELPGLDFLSDDDDSQMAAKDDSPSFGFLGEMDEPAGPSAPESQLPEITLHDSEEPAAMEDSGEYALSADPIAPPLSVPVAGEPIANDEGAEIKNGKHRGAADDLPAVSPVVEDQSAKLDQAEGKKKGWFGLGKSKAAARPAPEMPSSAPAKPAASSPTISAAAIKAPAADADVDMDAAALDFLSDAPSGPAAAKSSKAAGKPAQAADSTPEIKVGPDRPKAAAPEDDELNSFFDSIGLQ